MTGVYTSFRIADMEGKEEHPKFPSGLFLLMYAARDGDGDVPGKVAEVELAFCGPEGQVHDIAQVNNPWSLLTGHPDAKNKMPARQFVNQPYFFCSIAHPSPELACRLLERCKKGEAADNEGRAFPWQKLTPSKLKNGLLFTLSGDKNKFLPGGPDRYGGWLLYYGMPYSILSDVATQIRKLSTDLATLKYPTGGNSNGTHAPYPASTAEADAEFGRAAQCCVHRFQEEASEGQARLPTGSGVPASWTAVQGKLVELAKLTGHEPGIVDSATASAIAEWLDKKVVRPGIPLVEDRKLWGDRRLWWRQWALEELCSTLGALYAPLRGSSFRKLEQTGGGQASQSKHKIGMAFDLNANQAEPATAAPFGVEADFEPVGTGANKTFRPRWLLYLHASFDVQQRPEQLQQLRDRLTPVADRVRTRMKEHMGEPFDPDAEAFVGAVEKLVEELINSSQKPGAEGTGTQLALEFYRRAIRRFQWRENEDDGGDVQDKEVEALADGKANRLSNAGQAKSWLNYSRLAHRLGLFSIGARDDFCPPGFKTTKAAKQAIKLSPGDASIREQKATIMDRIADGIENAGPGALIRVYGPGDREFFVENFKGDEFDLKTIRDWIRRPSDDPEGLPPASIGFDYANNGVDLKITLLSGDDAKKARNAFFAARSQLKAEIVAVGSGLQFISPLTLNTVMTLGDIAQGIDKPTVLSPLPKTKKGEPGPLDVILRPRFYRPFPLLGKAAKTEPHGADPGRFHFEILPSGQPLSLEWWHQELDYGGKDWIVSAEQQGFSRVVLSAASTVNPNDSDPLWQGGLGFSKPSNYKAPADPGRQPATPEMPNG